MRIRQEQLGQSINYDGSTYLIEDTKDFIKIAKAYGFDVFEKKAKKSKDVDVKAD